MNGNLCDRDLLIMSQAVRTYIYAYFSRSERAFASFSDLELMCTLPAKLGMELVHKKQKSSNHFGTCLGFQGFAGICC